MTPEQKIAEQHARLREEFLVRDAIRFPDGWKLPVDEEDDE